MPRTQTLQRRRSPLGTAAGSLLTRRTLVLALAAVALLALPLVLTDSYSRNLAILVLVYAVVASSWDVTVGTAGIFNMGHVAFFGLGAYASGIAANELGVSPWLGLLIGTVVAVIASVIAFLPAIRLRGIYVSLVTFAFAQLAVHLVLSQSKYTGGHSGLAGLPTFELFGINLNGNARLGAYYLIAIIFVASLLLLRAYLRSRYGLALLALKDYEEYAMSRGVPVVRYRLGSFMVSAAVAGLVGSFYAHYLGVVSVEVFSFSLMSLMLTLILVGGMGTLYGPIVGSVLVTIGYELLFDLGVWRFVVMAALIIVTTRFLPEGMWPWIERLWRRPSASSSAAE